MLPVPSEGAFPVHDGNGQQLGTIVCDGVVYYFVSENVWEWEGPRNWDIWRRDLNNNTSPPEPLLADPEKNETPYFCDGKSLAFLHQGPFGDPVAQVFNYDLMTGRITHIGTGRAGDGSGITTQVSNLFQVFIDPDQQNRVFLYDLRDGSRYSVSTNAAAAVFLCGNNIAWVAMDDGRVYGNTIESVLKVGPQTCGPCEVEVPLLIVSNEYTRALSIAIEYARFLVCLVRIEKGAAFRTLGEPDFWQVNLEPPSCDGSAGATVAIVVDTQGEVELPPGENEVARLVFRREAAAGHLACGESPVRIRSGCYGSPPVELLISGSYGERIPSTQDGVVRIAEACFIRGDATLDGDVDIADAVKIIFHRFRGEGMACLDAGDANDDGSGPDLADALHVLYYLFRSGFPPPAPFPGSGADPSSDTLGCASCP